MAKPLLTEVERLKLDNYNLRIHILQQQVQQMLIERDTHLRSIEAAHPGFEWSETEGLVEKGEGVEYTESAV
jgi:hypothetical protein